MLRSLLRRPGFALVCVLTFALGLGSTTAVFSVVDAVLLKPLEFPQPDRLVVLRESKPPQFDDFSASTAAFVAWQRDAAALESAGLSTGAAFVWLPPKGDPVRIIGHAVTPGWFDVLGIPAAMGRTLRAEDLGTAAGGTPGVVVTHNFWQRRLGGAPDAVGRVLTLDGVGMTIVGVMPPDFRREKRAEIYQVLDVADLMKNSPQGHFLFSMGRLKPGATVEQLQAQLGAIDASLAQQYGADRQGWRSKAHPALQFQTEGVRGEVRTLFIACALLLALACVNVSGLVLVRAAGRAQEFAVRMALGAGRTQLARLVVGESLLLAAAGALLGLPLAVAILQGFAALDPDILPRGDRAGLDLTALGFAAGIALVAGLAAGLVPALTISREKLESRLRAASAGAGGGGRSPLRFALVAGQVALAAVLLASAGLLARSFMALRAVDPGFTPNGAVTIQVSLPDATYSTKETRRAFVRRLDEQLRALTGASAAGMSQTLPIDGNWNESILIEGRTPDAPGEELTINWFAITPGWFEAMGMRLLSGRLLKPGDLEGAPVCVVSESFARRWLPPGNPLGRRVARTPSKGEPAWREIVGVVADIKVYSLDRASRPQFFEPLDFSPSNSVNVVARALGGLEGRSGADALPLVGAMRRAVLAVDPQLPAGPARTLESIVDESIGRRRLSMNVLGAFAGSALLVAALGVYGAVAFAVARRTREYGVRLALGAPPERLRRGVLADALKLAGAGLLLGVPLSLLAGRALRAQLFGVGAADPLTFALIALALATAVLAAAWLPARRAARVNPVEALRAE